MSTVPNENLPLKPSKGTDAEQKEEAVPSAPRPPQRCTIRRARGEGPDAEIPDSNRRQFLVRMTLFGAAAAAYITPKVQGATSRGCLSPPGCTFDISGAGSVESVCGTSNLTFSGSAQYWVTANQIIITGLSLVGEYVSGLNLGTVTFENVGAWQGPINEDNTFQASGTLHYTDDLNNAISNSAIVTGTVVSHEVATMALESTGQGVCGAGESTAEKCIIL